MNRLKNFIEENFGTIIAFAIAGIIIGLFVLFFVGTRNAVDDIEKRIAKHEQTIMIDTSMLGQTTKLVEKAANNGYLVYPLAISKHIEGGQYISTGKGGGYITPQTVVTTTVYVCEYQGK